MVSTAAAWQCRSQLKVDVDGHGQEVMWNVENVGYPACLTLQSLLTILLMLPLASYLYTLLLSAA
jgi:hypothetical protein